jgi:glyoxylase-like metal-dependent hydrolase (beta-lactamase superfamily II)
MVRNASEIYPALHPSRETMTWYETLPRETFRYGAAQWTGWRVGDICVLEGHGHSADSLVFYVPAHRFLFFVDETTSIPIWKDTNTDNSARSLRNALAMVDAGAVESFVASHYPMEVITGADAIRETITSSLETKLAFDREVSEAVAQFPDGVAIDDLFTYLRGHTQGVVARLADAQFPRASTFLKLTLLNFCRKHLTETQGATGRPVFK